MTIKTFYKKLREHAVIFNWRLEGSYIRGHTKDNKCFCPVTALAYAIHGKIFTTGRFDEAGTLLGLSNEDSRYIAIRSDDSSRKPGRRTLMKAVGLK